MNGSSVSRCIRLIACLAVSLPPSLPLGAQDFDFFEKRVRPILANRCYACHGPNAGEGQAGLRLDSLPAMLKGGRSGPVIVPGEPTRSLLIHAINHDTFVQMPPKTKLPLDEVQALTRWVEIGAPWPGSELLPSKQPAAKPEPVKADHAPIEGEEETSHWAFEPVVDPAMPEVEDASWPQSPIDRFVLARLEEKGLRPAAPADKRTLLRRATIDLHGLPPTLDEVRAFLADDSLDAFAKVVDRLLASPRYGERWGRHWLDVARYADSNGMDDNIVHADAWRYRDYVIDAFNRDKPYDQFIREQLAGDLITQWGHNNRAEGLIATGFLMLGPKMVGEDDPVKQKLDFADEQLATTARAFMALTVDCARCHDHKFDPIPTEDYYSMLGIFTSTKTVLTYRVTSKLNAVALTNAEDERRLSEIEDKFDYHDDLVTNLNSATTPEEVREGHKKAVEEAKEEYETIPKAMAVSEGEIEDLPVLIRGSHLTPGETAPRRFLRVLSRGERTPIGPDHSGRKELANWIASPDHPLTARVMVNRIWKGHFGEGIVRTPDNFGRLGDAPSHPALLDWLAARFVAGGWSIKLMHRLIMLTSAYQMRATGCDKTKAAGAGNSAADCEGDSPEVLALDPENRLLRRMNLRRMEAEVIRDSLLAVAGELDLSRGGKPVPHPSFTNLNGEGRSRDPKLYQTNRRSVYLPVLRSALYQVFDAFDFANPSTINGRRSSTTVAPQALFMMNSELIEQASRKLAERLHREAASGKERIALAHELLYSRPVSERELELWIAFLSPTEGTVAAGEGDGPSEGWQAEAWQSLCRVMLSSNEFVYVE